MPNSAGTNQTAHYRCVLCLCCRIVFPAHIKCCTCHNSGTRDLLDTSREEAASLRQEILRVKQEAKELEGASKRQLRAIQQKVGGDWVAPPLTAKELAQLPQTPSKLSAPRRAELANMSPRLRNEHEFLLEEVDRYAHASVKNPPLLLVVRALC